MNKQRAFIWDLDGTLIDSYGVIVSSLYKTYKKFGVELVKEDILKEVITTSVVAFINKTKDLCGLPFETIKETYSEISLEDKDKIRIIPHAKDVLKILSENGDRNFLFTHRGESTRTVLEQLELSEYFQEIITSKSGLPRKPDPSAILYLIEKYNLNKETTYYVGDRTIDSECASNAHIQSIMFLPEYSVAVPTGKENYLVKDLLDIEKIY